MRLQSQCRPPQDLAAFQSRGGLDAREPSVRAPRARSASWKRSLDLGVFLLILPLWAPLMLVIAICIKFVSSGPVFYCQERVGYNGRRFVMLKFRSMRANAETRTHEDHLVRLMGAATPMTKLDAGDSRLIFGGRVLRATGLDELPQFINVLQGEMSIVGPRPSTLNEFRNYKPWHHERLSALPGLTGFWQVNGKNRTTFDQMIQMDIDYARQGSFWGDVQIMLKTFPVLLGQTFSALQAPGRSQGAVRQSLPAVPPVRKNPINSTR